MKVEENTKYIVEYTGTLASRISKKTGIKGYTEGILEPFFPDKSEVDKMTDADYEKYEKENNELLEKVCASLNASQFQQSVPTDEEIEDKIGEFIDSNRKFHIDRNDWWYLDYDAVNGLINLMRSQLPQREIDWKELRYKFFAECVDEIPMEKNAGFICKKINITPHDLFEWFKYKIEGENNNGENKK